MTVAMLSTSTNGEPVQATSSTTGTGTVNTAAASTTASGNSGNKPQWLYNEQGQLIKKLPNGKEQVMPGTAGGNNTGGGTVTTLSETSGVTTISVSLTNTGHAFLPRSPEQYTHDADGNLTSDGRWTYQWDAENRLVAMETSASVTSVLSVVRTRLEFAYDHQSRRISKLVSNWNASSNQYQVTSNLLFVYDSWNLLAELSALTASPLPLRTYAWGLDLSGSEQGAGGIGGLLWMTSHLPLATSHFYAFDGNGNVAALLNAATGQLSAEYEYSPFGETIRATGSAAGENVFRFSTKYTDAETGLLYYGYRYCRPSIGQWVSRDPIYEAGSLNLSCFINNRQTDYVDPQGLDIFGLGKGAYKVVEWIADDDLDDLVVDKCEILIVWGHGGGQAKDGGLAKISSIKNPKGCGYAAVVGCYADRVPNSVALPGYTPVKGIVHIMPETTWNPAEHGPNDRLWWSELDKIKKAARKAAVVLCKECKCESVTVTTKSYKMAFNKDKPQSAAVSGPPVWDTYENDRAVSGAGKKTCKEILEKYSNE